MGKFKPFAIGALVGAGVLFFALQFHVVHTHDGVRIVPRTPQHGIGLAYADIRTWDADKWNDFPELARALVANGASDLVAVSVTKDLMDSVSSDSPIDDLRGMLNSDAEDTDPLFDDPGFLPLRKDSEPTSFNRSTDMDDLLDAPFPRDANRQPFGRSSDDTSVARRTGLSAEDVFSDRSRSVSESGEGMFREESTGFREVESTAPSSRGTNSSGTGSGRNSSERTSELSREEETRLLEEMLFGDDSSEGSAPATNSNSGFGAFEEVTSQLENRADEAMNRARRGLQDSIDRSTESVSRFARGQIEERLPSDVGSIFKDAADVASAADSTSQPALPPEIEALRNGFDPFVK
ncbi:MAG: hypothetical protein NXI04_17805 [Planctomycetaceae bacterium]|nr:hypothetical protein [Planctomycetaceae bacterium]